MDTIPHILSPAELVGRRVREIRNASGTSQRELADRLAELRHPIHRTQLARLERGESLGAVDHLVALAVALGVSPAQLLAPADDETEVELVRDKLISADLARRWVAGGALLPGADPRPFFAALPEETQRELMLKGLTAGPLSQLAWAATPEDEKKRVRQEADRLAWETAEAVKKPSGKREGGSNG